MDIYKITNTVTGKCYVGFSKDAKYRFERHISLAERGVNRRLYDSMRKHGISNFALEIIATCDTKDEAAQLEKFWISELNSIMPHGYNMTAGGEGGNTLQGWTEAEKVELYSRQAKTRTGFTHSEETRRKISDSHRGKVMSIEQRLHLSKTMKELGILPPLTIGKIPWIAGKTHSLEARRKISEARLGRKWESMWSDEYIKERKNKMRGVFLGKKNPNFVELTLSDKIHILKTIASSFDFYIKDSKQLFGFSEFKVRQFFKNLGIFNFQSFKKNNKDNWENTIRKLILNICCEEGVDVTQLLGIQKWERPIPAQLRGLIKGNFPSEIPKTDQERVQNIKIEEYVGQSYEVTEKLHGSSMTCYLDKEGEFHVCSRNLDLKFDENNAYWKAAIKFDVERKMRAAGLAGVAIQGELCGAGINGNNYNLGLDWFVFDVYVVGEGYMPPKKRRDLLNVLGLKHVPVISVDSQVTQDIPTLLDMADGKSYIAPCLREGFVYKSEDGSKSFKVISNEWLILNKE